MQKPLLHKASQFERDIPGPVVHRNSNAFLNIVDVRAAVLAPLRRRTSMQTSPMVKYNLGLFRRSAIQRIPETPWRFRVLPHITYGYAAYQISAAASKLVQVARRCFFIIIGAKNEVELNSPDGSMQNSSGCEAGTVEGTRYSDLPRLVVVEIYHEQEGIGGRENEGLARSRHAGNVLEGRWELNKKEKKGLNGYDGSGAYRIRFLFLYEQLWMASSSSPKEKNRHRGREYMAPIRSARRGFFRRRIFLPKALEMSRGARPEPDRASLRTKRECAQGAATLL
ncbi:hypothetical protein B0H14DRAFT_2597305 [Mycena olivaceomarginata]|nr:hypothetical protein B0H14DRAFT_2597305 [Mycena olivaceomarginata]